MVCRQCGRKLPDHAKFCIGCGLPVQQPAKAPQAPVPPVSPTVQPPVQPEFPARPSPSPKPPVQPDYPVPPVPPAQPPRKPDRAEREAARPQMTPAYRQTVPSRAPEQAAPDYWDNPDQDQYVQSSKRRRAVPVGLRILSIFLCVLLILSGFAATVIGALRLSYSPKQVKAMVHSVDLSSIDIPMNDGTSLSLIAFFENQTGIDLMRDYGITKGEMDAVLEQPFVKDFVGEVVSGYTDYLIFGTSLNALTRNRVVDFLRANDREIQQYTGFSFREHEHDLTQSVDEYLDHYDLDAIFDNSLHAREISSDYLKDLTGVDLDAVRFALSGSLLLLLGILLLILALLIFLCLLRSPRSAVISLGVSLAVIGVLDLLACLGWKIGMKHLPMDLLRVFIEPFFGKLLILGLAALAMGFILIILRLFMRAPSEETV